MEGYKNTNIFGKHISGEKMIFLKKFACLNTDKITARLPGNIGA